MKKIVKDTEAAAKELAAEAGKAAEKVVSEAKAATKATKKAAGKAAVKTAAKTAEVVEKVQEKAEEKAAAKTAVKKAPAKKAAVKETIYLQYLGKEISKDDLMKQVKEVWTKQMKRKVADLKSVALYLKPEENMAYYVINDDITGSISLN